MRHLESLDNPVVARLAVAAQGLTKQVGVGLMAIDGLVDDIDDFQVGIFFLDGVHPLDNGFITLLRGEILDPTGVLRTPYQAMELEGESFLLGIVEGGVGPSPVV